MGRILGTRSYELIENVWLLLLRLVIGGSMLTHGIAKLQMLFSAGTPSFPDPVGIGVTFTLILVIFAEFICSVMLILGIFTRYASIPLIINMLVASFVVHGSDPFAAKELALLYLVVYLTILVFGGGSFSIDRFLKRR